MIRPETVTQGAQVEHWRIVESLGQRGHGALYRVQDVRRPGEAQVMRLSLRKGEGLFSDRVARLQATHPNMARLHYYGRWPRQGDGCFFSVREDVRGQSLAHWVETNNPTFLQIVTLLSGLASALDDTHARDTWHRDFHPDNIQVRDEDAEPVLLDLRAGGNEGLDALLQAPFSHDTLGFRSPEELRFLRSNLGRRYARYRYLPTDDLYALGATAYWLVTGHPPFSPSLSSEQLHTEIELRAPRPPWEVNGRVPKPLGAIILRLMSKQPEARPHSGESLIAELMVAVSAGARSLWAKRVFDWEPEQAGAEASTQRVRRPEPPEVSPLPGPRLPRVVYFSPRSEQLTQAVEGTPERARIPRGAPVDPLGPWSRLM